MNNKKINGIWIEAAGCSGNIISLLNAKDGEFLYMLRNMINLKYNNSIMAKEGETAFEEFLKTLDTEFILFVDGAVSLRDNGKFNIIANYNGKSITGMDAVEMAGDKAKYIISVGTCASYGGISAAKPNPANCVPVDTFLKKEVIKLPGCPCHPDWLIGTIAHIITKGKPDLDSEGRPLMFYERTLHDICNRRSYFDKGIFAEKLGDKECMIKLGCRGPRTKVDCATRKWNDYVNWPIGDNTPCIGCADVSFPGDEAFVKYDLVGGKNE